MEERRVIRLPWAYIFLENLSNSFYAKHRFASAGTRIATRLAGSLVFKGRVTLLPGKTFCHVCTLARRLPGSTWPNADSQSKRDRKRCDWDRNKAQIWLLARIVYKACVNLELRHPAVYLVKRGNFFFIRTLDKIDSAGRVTLLQGPRSRGPGGHVPPPPPNIFKVIKN